MSQDMLILSDGKPGHYNQSLGIIDRMSDVCAEIIEVKYKRKWRDNALRVLVRLVGGFRLPHKLIRGMLRWSMEYSSAEAVLGAGKFRAILSTGSSVAAPNLLLGQLTAARTAVCTRPSPIGIGYFDLAILPEHMRPRRQAGNVVMALGVPNRITPEGVEAAGSELLEQLEIGDRGIIGILLGGDDRHYFIPPETASSLCDILLSVCEEEDMRIALTTSRRTDAGAEVIMKSRMSGSSLCCLAVMAGEPQEGNPVPDILGISDIVIVTEDSFSMVCEAASSGNKVIILEVCRRKRGDPKRQRIYKMLAERGYAKIADISSLRDAVLDFAGDESEPKALDDARIAADALRELIGE